MRNEEILILTFILFIQVVSFFQPDTHPWYMVWFPTLIFGIVGLICAVLILISIIAISRAKRAELLKIPEKKE